MYADLLHQPLSPQLGKFVRQIETRLGFPAMPVEDTLRDQMLATVPSLRAVRHLAHRQS
jgi:hypothetical protein